MMTLKQHTKSTIYNFLIGKDVHLKRCLMRIIDERKASELWTYPVHFFLSLVSIIMNENFYTIFNESAEFLYQTT